MAFAYEKNNPNGCSCTAGCNEDCQCIYARKINKDKLRIKDFETEWERKRVTTYNTCEDYCSNDSLSISKIEKDEHKPLVKESFQQIWKLAPGFRPFICYFKFKEKAGVLKEDNGHTIFHHSFFRSNPFDINLIEVQVIEPLH